MKLHPRYFIVSKAKLDASTFLLDLLQKHELTYAEAFCILGELTTRLAGMAVRDERREGGEVD